MFLQAYMFACVYVFVGLCAIALCMHVCVWRCVHMLMVLSFVLVGNFNCVHHKNFLFVGYRWKLYMEKFSIKNETAGLRNDVLLL